MRPLFKPFALVALISAALVAGLISTSGGSQGSNKSTGHKALRDAAREVYELTVVAYERGQVDDIEQLYRWSKRWMDQEFALGANNDTRAAAIESHLERMKQLEKIETARYEAGAGESAVVAATRFYRLEAETILAEAKK